MRKLRILSINENPFCKTFSYVELIIFLVNKIEVPIILLINNKFYVNKVVFKIN
jgi:hypothetical protein